MKWLLSLLTVLILGMALVTPIFAHGASNPQVVNQPLGPFIITVWTSADPIRDGTAHVSIAIAEENETGANTPVLNQVVTVIATPPTTGEQPITLPATHDNAANRLLYEVDFPVETQGLWRIEVDVNDKTQTVGFDVTVDRRQWLGPPLYGAVALVAIGVIWFLFRDKTPSTLEL